MDWPRFLGTALVVGVVGPLVWLFAGWLANVLRSFGYKLVHRWRSKQSGT
jgi:hypothetical protein